MAAVFVALILGTAEPSQELLITVGGGTVLSSAPKPQVSAFAEWYPFPQYAGQGLKEVGINLGVMLRPHSSGTAALAANFIYGRPRSSFWASFEAGGMAALGWQAQGNYSGNTTEYLVSVISSLRIGYNFVSLRLFGAITSSEKVLHGDYYAASLEFGWRP